MFGRVRQLADEEIERIAEAILTNPKVDSLVTCVIEEVTEKVIGEIAARLAVHAAAKGH